MNAIEDWDEAEWARMTGLTLDEFRAGKSEHQKRISEDSAEPEAVTLPSLGSSKAARVSPRPTDKQLLDIPGAKRVLTRSERGGVLFTMSMK